MNVPVVFCFDKNFVFPAAVAIKSLIYNSNKNTSYKIYCIVSNDVGSVDRKEITKQLTGDHCVNFIDATNRYATAHVHRGITEAAYYRLMLHDLLPDEDKIIYLDVDVLVNGDLSNVYRLEMSDNYISAVKNLYIYQTFEKQLERSEDWCAEFKDLKDGYINSGFLIMNLRNIRKSEVWKEWQRLSELKWEFHDQDILNKTCKNKIKFLAPKYNSTYSIREKNAYKWDLFSSEEINEKTIIYHFTAKKPWDSKYMKQSDVWWEFVKKNTDLYAYFSGYYRSKNTYRKVYSRKIRRVRQVLTKFLEWSKYRFNDGRS